MLAALGAGLAGALWLANAITFQPKTYFSPQWTAYMIFMALVGGLGTFEGALIGAVIFFAIEALFGAAGVWYLIGLGATALAFALFLPRGLWGWVETSFGLNLSAGRIPPASSARSNERTPERKGASQPITKHVAPRVAAPQSKEGSKPMLFGKIIVVTGVSSGIGARFGQLALALGADVIGLDVNAPASPLSDFVQVDRLATRD